MKESVRTYLKAMLNLAIFIVIFLLCAFLLPRLIVFFMPFVIGWIVALIASPLVRFFEEKLKIKRKAGTAFVIVAVLAVVISLGYFVCARLAEETVNFVTELPQIWSSTQKDFENAGKKLTVLYNYLPVNVHETVDGVLVKLEDYLGEFVGTLGTPTIEGFSRFVKNLPSIIIGIIMGLLAAYFFVADKEYLSKMTDKCMPLSFRRRFVMVRNSMRKAVGGYFKAQFKIEVWIYLLLVIGLMILHVEYAFVIAIGVAILDLLPFFGTGAVLLPWAIIKALGGDYRMTFGLLIIWGVGQLVRQLIQPKIVGDSIGIAPIPTLILLFMGYKFGGVIGMIIAVPLGIIVINMYQEGIFETTVNSVKILYAGINNFRRIEEKDMIEVEKYREEEEKRLAQVEAKKEKRKRQSCEK